MKQQILVIHGGNAFETYEEYLLDLQESVLTIERLTKRDWKSNLSENLGDNFEVYTPRMPNSQNARYAEWKIWFEKLILLLDDDVILVGHSLGGILLVKYLSENKIARRVRATFLVAAPYNTPKHHPFVDFTITTPIEGFEHQAGQKFMYHSTDDKVVPFENAERYVKDLPSAKLRTFTDRGHFNSEQFPEIVEDIKHIN